MLRVAILLGFIGVAASWHPANAQSEPQSTEGSMRWEAGMAENLKSNCHNGIVESCEAVKTAYLRAAWHARRLGKEGQARKYERLATRQVVPFAHSYNTENFGEAEARASSNAAISQALGGLNQTMQGITANNIARGVERQQQADAAAARLEEANRQAYDARVRENNEVLLRAQQGRADMERRREEQRQAILRQQTDLRADNRAQASASGSAIKNCLYNAGQPQSPQDSQCNARCTYPYFWTARQRKEDPKPVWACRYRDIQ